MNIFNSYVKEYDSWYEKNKYAYFSEIKAIKKVIPKRGIGLEIGVGTGRFAGPLGITFGVDPSKKMLEIAKKRGVKTVLAKGEKLPFGDNKFDYILIAITLCFVDNPEQVIKEAKRVLKDKGKLIIAIVDKNSHLGEFYQQKKKQRHRFYKEAKFYSAREVIKMLEKYQFNRITSYQTIFHSLEKIKKIEQPKKGFGKGGFVVICGKKN